MKKSIKFLVVGICLSFLAACSTTSPMKVALTELVTSSTQDSGTEEIFESLNAELWG